MKQLTEHEQLKAICDEIGYECKYDFQITYFEQCGENDFRTIDVREIIFTPEFMKDLYEYYGREHDEIQEILLRHNIMTNLNNPVEYLYNLLDGGKN